MILFHHRAEIGLPSLSQLRSSGPPTLFRASARQPSPSHARAKAGCRGWIRTTIVASKGDVLLLDDPAMNWRSRR